MSGLPAVLLLTADAPGLSAIFPPQWGIFSQQGQPVLVSDSVGSVGFQRQYDVSDYSQEQGAFESYNKVQVPYSATVTLLSSLTRFQLLNTLEPIVASLQLVSIVMPELSYPSANLLGYSFRRTVRSGVTLIAVDISCKEIRTSASSTLSSSSSNSAAQSQATGGTARPVGQVNGGSNLAGGSSSTPPTTAAAINTGSTNAAYPTQSGPVQPVSPSDLGTSANAIAMSPF